MTDKEIETKTLIANLDIMLIDSDSESDSDSDNLSENILDLSLSAKKRIKYLEEFLKEFGDSETNQLINRLCTMYTMSGTKLLQEYLFLICTESNIPAILKLIVTNSLCYDGEKCKVGYNALNIVCKDLNITSVPTPSKIKSIVLLMNSEDYKMESLEYFKIIISNKILDCDFRYKTILSLENEEKIDKHFFLEETMTCFFNNVLNFTMYRILAGQYLILKYKKVKETEKVLLEFSLDLELDYNLRADAADVVLRMGTEENKIIARDVIMALGRSDSNTHTIFENAQNVHDEEIENSLNSALEFFSTIKIKNTVNVPYIKKKLLLRFSKESKDKDSIDKIKITMNRITMDRALYSKYNYSLENILIRLWCYIINHESKEEIILRLIEEIQEMSGTCSSGYSTRLVNVISGYGDFEFRISWKDQIIANFSGRLNCRMKNIVTDGPCLYKDLTESKDFTSFEDFQSLVLEEVTLKSNNYSGRKNFLLFFRRNMLSIREEMFKEFIDYIDECDFDLYFRNAISNYETGSRKDF
jgi:hypothetical protein